MPIAAAVVFCVAVGRRIRAAACWTLGAALWVEGVVWEGDVSQLMHSDPRGYPSDRSKVMPDDCTANGLRKPYLMLRERLG